MSFASEVKKELLEKEYENQCCKKALLYGMLVFGKSFTDFSIYCQTENRDIAEVFRSLLADITNVKTSFSVSPSGRIFTVEVENKNDCQKVRNFFSHEKREISLKINHSNFYCEECRKAFLAGAFLVCGTVSSPQKDYHLEFTVPYINLSKDFFLFLQELDLSPKETKRRGYPIIYFKESESIEDCLYLMGAGNSMFEMINVEIEKELRNSVNRKTNCDTANIERMAKASASQIECILLIKDKKGLDYLNDDLKNIALLRMENPDASLSELSSLSEPKLSKSGINHRLSKIMAIAQELK